MKLILFTLVLISLSTSFAEYDPTDDLMFAFGSRCKGRGPINSVSSRDGASLKHIIDGIKDDSACKGVAGALKDIESLNISQVLRDRVAENDFDYLSTQSSDLELAIATESKNTTVDTDYLIALKTELVKTKINIVKSRKLANQERTKTRLKTVENVQSYSSLLFSRLQQSDKCLVDKPNLAAEIGAQVLAIGSTLSSGLVGSLLLATGNIIDNFVSFFRNRNISNKMKVITNNRIGEAIGCSFEGLAYTYCQARDVDTIVKFNKNRTQNPPNAPSWLDGVGVIGESGAAYTEWINRVDSGTAPTTLGRASDKKVGILLGTDLKVAKTDLEGLLNSSKRIVEQSSDKADATASALIALATKISQSCNSFNQCSPGGPFAGTFSSDPSCGALVYLYSKGTEKGRKGDLNKTTCVGYVNDNFPNPPDIDTEVGPIIDKLIEATTKTVNITVSQSNESNPDKVIAQLEDVRDGHTAKQFLTSALAYLDNLLEDKTSISRNQNQRDLILKTKAQITNTFAILARTKEVDPANPTGKKITVLASKKLADVASELTLGGNDSNAVPAALKVIIDQDIEQRISVGQIDDNLAALMHLSSTDGLGELLRYNNGLDAAKDQARNARTASKKNLEAMANVFSENLSVQFEKLNKESKTDRDAADSLGLLCMQSLSVPDAPKVGEMDVSKYCSGRTYQGIYEKPELKMDYNELSKKPFEERTCAVYDFYRKSYLYGLKGKRPATTSGKAVSTKK